MAFTPYCSHCGQSNIIGITLVCKHIAESIKARAPYFPTHAFIYADEKYPELGPIYPCTCCDNCIKQMDLPPTGSAISEQKAQAILDEIITGVCPGCFRQWQANH